MEDWRRIRRSQRIREKGIERVYYYEKQDDIEIESSFVRITGHTEITANASIQSDGSLEEFSTFWPPLRPEKSQLKPILQRWGQKKQRGRRLYKCHHNPYCHHRPRIIEASNPLPKNHVISTNKSLFGVCDSSSNNEETVHYDHLTVSSSIQQEKTRGDFGMTIHEPIEEELAPNKTPQWQPFTSLYRLLTDPDASEEMDMVDQDACLSNATCDSGSFLTTNIEVSLGAHPAPFTEEGIEHITMPPLCTQNRTDISPYLPRSIYAEAYGKSTQVTLCPTNYHQDQEQTQMCDGKSFSSWRNSVKFNETAQYHSQKAMNAKEHNEISTQDTNYASKLNIENGKRTATHQATIRKMIQDQRATLTYMHSVNQPQENFSNHSPQVSDLNEMHRWKTQSNSHSLSGEPTRCHHDLVPRFSQSSPLDTCQNRGAISNMKSTGKHKDANSENVSSRGPSSKKNPANLTGANCITNSTGEHSDATCAQMPCTSFRVVQRASRWSRSNTIGGEPSLNILTPVIQQDHSWIETNTPCTSYRTCSDSNVIEASMHEEHPQTLSENLTLGNRGTSQRQEVPIMALIQDNNHLTQAEQIQHKWSFASPQGSHIVTHRSSSSEPYMGLEGHLSNMALLEGFGAYNPKPFDLNETQEHLSRQTVTSNLALLHQFGSCEKEISIETSPYVGSDGIGMFNSHHTEGLQVEAYFDGIMQIPSSSDLPIVDDTQQGSVLHYGNTHAQVTTHAEKRSKFSDLHTELGKGNLQNDVPQLKQRRKKIRCRVLKDKKPRGKRGPKPRKMKDDVNETKLHRDPENLAQSSKIAENETFQSSYIGAFEEATTKQLIYGDFGYDVLGLFCNEGMTYYEECASATSGISISQEGNCRSTVASDTGIHEWVDFLGLSDERCRVGHKDATPSPTSQSLITSNDPQKIMSVVQGHELVLYDQNFEFATIQSRSDTNAWPLCLFASETSSTGSTELTIADGSLPLANVSEKDNLRLVLYNQKRDLVMSRSLRTYKKIRAKVQLDPESQRVWLQLENGGNPEVDTDPDRVKYWEKERENMKKKVDLFIQKMHFVQGDRRFSPWKGSIVDSVVGAFLTQNVSDHLSSSAFMSVASRFPVIPRKVAMDACAGDMCMSPRQKQCDEEVSPSIMERGCFGSPEKLPVTRSVDSNNCIVIDCAATEIANDEVNDFCKPTEHEERLNSDSQGQISIGYEGYYDHLHNNVLSTPDSQPWEKFSKGNTIVIASDDERNSRCTFDIVDSRGTIEDIYGSIRKPFPSRNSKVCRMLQFDDTNELGPTSCSTLETNKHVSFTLVHETEMISDNISDQQSESESAIGSCSLQDSNLILQLTTMQDLNFQADMMIQSNDLDELDTTIAIHKSEKHSKKRTLSVSSMSGLERAQLEANQKGRKKNHHKDWESVRRKVLGTCTKENTSSQRLRRQDHEDSVDWDAVRLAQLGELAETIKERGMHHVLSGRIKAFLTSLHEDHGSVDLEWLRNLSTEMAREYLMSIHGLGVKSVECIRLLTLHHLAFPVDTNVGRICVRLGWVPIEPLPEEVQLHLVELYPIQETIQKYLWPRLCTLDQRTLYELHYQMITFGKVFCTKSKPNCNACPLRTECKHFASAYASAKPLLTGSKQDEGSTICSGGGTKELPGLSMDTGTTLLEYPQDTSAVLSLSQEAPLISELDSIVPFAFQNQTLPSGASSGESFYVEMPASPEQTYEEDLMDIEDMYIYKNYNDYSLDLIGEDLSIDQCLVPFNDQLHSQEEKLPQTPSTLSNALFNPSPSTLLKNNSFSQHGCCNDDLSSTSQGVPSCTSQCITKSDVACTPVNQTDIVELSQTAIVVVPESAHIPAPPLKNIGRMRTIHYVYEIPDDHCLLKSVDPREKDDPCCYLLAIWSPGETPESQQEIDELCRDEFAYSCSSSSGADETVAGTLLIPCRTAMHGSFPLNGTYFQVNEVFADHESSLHPLQVPRSLIWSLRRRFVYFGTSVPNIFKGFSTNEIKDCFWRGHVCVRGFDRQTRAPKPLVCRLHFPISKQPQKTRKNPRKRNDQKPEISTSHINSYLYTH